MRERRRSFRRCAPRGMARRRDVSHASIAYLWNARRCRHWRRRRRHRRDTGGSAAAGQRLVVRDPARAGFYFTLAAMWRSNSHRLTLACAAAAGFAMALVALSSADAQAGARPSRGFL